METVHFPRLAAWVGSLLLSACGGGVYLSVGDTDGGPPQIEIAASSTSAQAGQTVRLVAAAADENGIERVAFYRIDGNSAVLIATDTVSPYETQIVVPSDGRSSLRVFAWAVDGWGNEADSEVVSIAIVP